MSCFVHVVTLKRVSKYTNELLCGAFWLSQCPRKLLCKFQLPNSICRVCEAFLDSKIDPISFRWAFGDLSEGPKTHLKTLKTRLRAKICTANAYQHFTTSGKDRISKSHFVALLVEVKVVGNGPQNASHRGFSVQNRPKRCHTYAVTPANSLTHVVVTSFTRTNRLEQFDKVKTLPEVHFGRFCT